jgi:hypothetical protein
MTKYKKMNTNITINTNIKNNSDGLELQPPMQQPIQTPMDLQATPEPKETTQLIKNNLDASVSPDTPDTPDSTDSPDTEEQASIVEEIFKKPLYMIYNEKTEINEESQLLNYHTNKDCGYWKIAKMIVAHSTKEKNNTEFYLDYLDIDINKNNDNLENIEKVFYRNNLDIDIVYEFEGAIAKFIVENLKIFKFKPLGYIFNKDVEQNKWDFTISVITSKNIYTSNRYISETQIGYY